MLAIDWAHAKDWAIYDGKEARLVPWQWNENGKKTTIADIAKWEGCAVIEHGAPLMYLYRLVRIVPTYTVSPNDVATEREYQGLEKSDLNDVKVIYELGEKAGLNSFSTIESFDGVSGQPRLKRLELEDHVIKLAYLYHQYLYALKGLNATQNLKKAMRRHFGDDGNATLFMLSLQEQQCENRCKGLKREISAVAPKPPQRIIAIKGMSKWLWAGIVICADPRLFPTKAAYKKWCGLVDRKSINHKFNRSASRIYWLCADQFIRQRSPQWRGIYDIAKEELSNRGGYTHPHSGAKNRLMTAFALFVFDIVKEDGIAEQRALW